MPNTTENRWTDTEIETLLELKAKGYSSTRIAEKIGRTATAVKNKFYWLKTHQTYKERKSNPVWTHEETELLIALAETMPRSKLMVRYNQIASQKGFTKRTLVAIGKKLFDLGQSWKPSSGWYGVNAIAIGLGFSLTRIHNWLKRGLKHHAEGKNFYVRNDDLVDFILNNSDCMRGISDDGLQWFLALLLEEKQMRGRNGRPEYTRALEA